MPFLGTYYEDAVEYASSSTSLLPFDVLAGWLNTYVKGEVIVIIESCGAGSAIYSPYEAENSMINTDDISMKDTKLERADQSQPFKVRSFSASTFTSDAISAFAAKDHSFKVKNSGVGALRKENKFYVLAAARHHQNSEGWEYPDTSLSYNVFTKWLIDGVSSSGDYDSNGIINLTELFQYIDYREKNENYEQRVQRYPVGSAYELFRY